MGHCCSCECKKRNGFLNAMIGDDWVFVEDSEYCESEDDQEGLTFMQDEDLDELLSGLEDALTWPKQQANFPNPACIESLNALMRVATAKMSQLASEERFDEADEVAESLFELADVWGNCVFQKLRITSFTREEISLGRFVATAGQYLKPEPLQEYDDESAAKLYFFILFDTDLEKYMCTYHLEYRYYGSSTADTVYILKLKPRREKLEVKSYGQRCPSYWELRKDVLQDFAKRKRSMVRS